MPAQPGTVRADGRIKCSNCPRWCTHDDYIGRRGGQVRQCLKCRVSDAKKKRRPDVVEKRNARHRERKYYIKYSAARRGYAFELTDEDVHSMIRLSCFYCGIHPQEVNETNVTNGIDRMDNMVHYTLSNCVPCCGQCNMMKKCLDAATFIRRCKHIAGVEDAVDAWVDRKVASYDAYRTSAEVRGLQFDLSLESFKEICAGSCAYCRRPNTSTNRNGVDRMNNSEGYVRWNCVSCCAECNQMKTKYGAEEFLGKCRAVARHWVARELPEMRHTCIRCVTRRRPFDEE